MVVAASTHHLLWLLWLGSFADKINGGWRQKSHFISNHYFSTMAKSSKRRQNNSSSSAKKQLKRIVAHANAQSNPLAALPSEFLSVNLNASGKNNGNAAGNNDTPSKNNSCATIHYYKSPLPEPILKQCLELFERNMGEMYRNSEWGLNMAEKRKELLHEDARFLIIMLHNNDSNVGQSLPPNDRADSTANTADDTGEIVTTTAAMAIDDTTKNASAEEQKVIGFAHFRFEPDEDSPHNPLLPITYLYELQISLTSHGLGQKLMTIVELLSLQLQMTKVILTVFKCNTGAMRFYLNKLKGYEVDECSPSNFEGEKDVDYEILSKRIGGGRKV